MERGELVPDQLIIDIIEVRLGKPDCSPGFVLDGFPRTVAQAQALDRLAGSKGMRFDRVLYLAVPEEELVRRVSGRLTCSICGRTYHFEPGQPQPDHCEEDGGLLLVREDDRPETARRRILVYLQNTYPVLDHYRRQSLVTEIDGCGPIDEVAQRILGALGRSRLPSDAGPAATSTGQGASWSR
jgi:adenylate kinase